MTDQIPKIPISKIDAAKRQLETAVNLYFQNADPVSIHTLSAAAHGILHALCKTRGIKSWIKNTGMIRKGKEKEFEDMLNKPQNFFKHGERDLNKVHDFVPPVTEFFIWDSCQMYMQITTECPKPFHIFSVWFCLKHPNIIEHETFEQALSSFRQSFRTEDRVAFYQIASEAYDLSAPQGFPN